MIIIKLITKKANNIPMISAETPPKLDSMVVVLEAIALIKFVPKLSSIYFYSLTYSISVITMILAMKSAMICKTKGFPPSSEKKAMKIGSVEVLIADDEISNKYPVCYVLAKKLQLPKQKKMLVIR